MKPNWTTERIEFLTSKWKEGWSAAQIAKHLAVTRSAAIGKLNRMGLIGFKPVAKPQGPKKFAAKPVSLAPKPVSDGGISFLDLKSTSCRWPLAQGYFCGAHAPKQPYCAHHKRASGRAA